MLFSSAISRGTRTDSIIVRSSNPEGERIDMSVRISRPPRGLVSVLLLSLLPSISMGAPATDGKLLTDVVFTHYGAASSNAELAQRLLSPATFARIEQELSGCRQNAVQSGHRPVPPRRFVVYVPSQPPPRGYALLVFVPPWQQAGLPQGGRRCWRSYGVIFVSAARSGNDENTMATTRAAGIAGGLEYPGRVPDQPGTASTSAAFPAARASQNDSRSGTRICSMERS